MTCGNNYYVYKHSTPNNKVYIGITKQNPNRRWRNGHGYKDSHLFFNAIIKYGWLNITHEILKEGLSFEDACKYEKYYIDLYKSNDREFGYNLTKGGGRKSDQINKAEFIKIGTGKNKGKEILVYNINGEYIGEFISSYQAAKVLNCDQGHIRKCCQHKEGRTKHKGYIFKYKEEIQ